MKQFTRDSTVRLKFTFKDADGTVTNPDGANLSLTYKPHGGGDDVSITYPLVQAGDEWTYEWDSSVASPCVITAHAQTTGGPPTSSIDAEFRLKANRANRELTGDW